MTIEDILKNERPVFILDDVEDKKTKGLVSQINDQMKGLLNKLEKFETFADSQLEGDYNRKIVMIKSLKQSYNSWSTISNACNNIAREESKAISDFNLAREQLINNLKILLNDSKKLPVISSYDVFNGEFVYAKKGHSVIILGGHNVSIVETLINEIRKTFYVEGNFEKIEPVELVANYSNVDKNVEACRNGVEEYYGEKPAKGEKILSLIENMEEAGRNLVFFATFKKNMREVGCNMKEVDVYERELFKKYVPLKKQLSKLLKVDFIDVCDLSVDEGEFPTQEFKAYEE